MRIEVNPQNSQKLGRTCKILMLHGRTKQFVCCLYVLKETSFPENLSKLDIRHSSGHPGAFRVMSQCLQAVKCLGVSDPLFESLELEVEKRRVFVTLQAVRILEFSYCSSLTDQMVRYIAEYCR